MDKPELFAQIRAAHEELTGLLAALTVEQLSAAGALGDWSVKDIVAHITAWQSLLGEWLEQAARGETPRPADWPEGYIDRLNAQIYEENRERPLADVMAEYHRSHARAIAAIDLHSDSELNDPHRFAWWDGEPILNLIAGDTYEHVAEHAVAIRAWLAVVQPHMNKYELLAKIRAGFASFEAVLARVSPAQMALAGAQGNWSVKDQIAHVAEWQSLCADWLGLLARGENPPDSAVSWTDDDIARLNAQFFERNRDRSAESAFAFLRGSYGQLLAAVEQFSDDELNDPYRFAWRRGRPLVNFVGGNSFWHYPEHSDAIEKWLATQG